MSSRPQTQTPLWTVSLRADQWDLIALALQRVITMVDNTTAPPYHVDRLGREFLRRRCDETIRDIQMAVPEAGKEPS